MKRIIAAAIAAVLALGITAATVQPASAANGIKQHSARANGI